MIPVKCTFAENQYIVEIMDQRLDSFRLQNNWHSSFQLMWKQYKANSQNISLKQKEKYMHIKNNYK